MAQILLNRATNDAQVIITTHSPILLDLLPSESLYVCSKVDGRTVVKPFTTWGPLGRQGDIHRDLDSDEDSTVSERLLRGDFDD